VLGGARATRPSLVDFVALLSAGVVAGVIRVPGRLQHLKLQLVLAVWVTLLVGAGFSLRNPPLVRSLATQAPVSFAALSWLGVGS
jgi:hypothetical protein